MKQLKFMLAAATAIGLATASQAAPLATSTGFERADAGPVGTATLDYADATDTYFFYDGDDPDDNESQIVTADAPAGVTQPKGVKDLPDGEKTRTKVLQVNTGTDPLLRTINPLTASGGAYTKPAATTLAQDTYVDTLVKFTVTPVGDDPEPKDGEDKLMIYLKESATETEGVTQTNLVVKAGYLKFTEEDGPEFGTKEYLASGVDVNPDQWYRLTVKLFKDISGDDLGVVQGFTVSIDGDVVTFNSNGWADTIDEDTLPTLLNMDVCGELENQIVPSMVVVEEASESTLQAVGFAGEGYVDDLIVTTDDPFAPDATGVDFTLTLAEGVSSVSFTVGGTTYTATLAESPKEFSQLPYGTLTFDVIEYADWYVADGDYKKDATITLSADGPTAATVDAKLVGGTGEGSTSTEAFVADAESADAAATALGVDNPVFTAGATETEAKATLTKGLAWAKKANVAPSVLNSVAFTAAGDPDGTTAEAYLLDCATDEVEEAKEDFELTGFTMVDGVPTFAVGANDVPEGGAYGNGKVEIRGKAALSDTEWAKDATNPKFFKAFLVK